MTDPVESIHKEYGRKIMNVGAGGWGLVEDDAGQYSDFIKYETTPA